ncbi:glycosyltransferase family 4 protein [Pseudomonas sp. SG20052]|uniref:MraY family glycosyltransferase n=1 Tax=Pseudomonas sp. SG20052 TaxID=3074147 RepID=UPI00287FAFE0|nr:glycosyltransferase family 4 protein [Pseudomonas sp. SG20052]WNF57348.1 glycosyltransferase family 4 protein [Pseudomonas sp. SG20052]
MSWWLLIFVLVFSYVLTALLRRYALARNLMDVPNQRSSHSAPTPRGGGVAIVVGFILALSLLFFNDVVALHVYLGISVACGLIAIIGFLDDHGHIPARWRLIGHFCAAAWGLYFLGGLPPIVIFGWTVSLGIAGNILAAFFLVWMLNLYNFMDGIDGLASVEAVTTCFGGALIYYLAGAHDNILLILVLGFGVLGFLAWNFPPARIFMGDAGSGFLGIALGFFSLQAAIAAPELLWSWLILLGVFIIDATVTLLRRLLRGEKVYEAHRSHAYQYASRQFGKHLPVTLAVLVINLIWLLPIAIWVGVGGLDGGLGLLLAYTPLIFLALKYKAGVRDN